MKDKINKFVETFKQDKYYSGPSEKTAEELSKKDSPQRELKKLQRETETLKDDFKKSVLEKFKNRRSIRKFSDRKVEWKVIYEIISGALNAPCAGGVENTEIVVIQDKKMKCEIGKIENQQYWLADAPFLLVCVRDNHKLVDLYPNEGELYSVQNTAAVIENIIILSHMYDLGACWVESCDNAVLKEALGIPDNKYVDAVIPIGFAMESPEVARCHEAAKLFFEKYGEKRRPTGFMGLNY